MAIIPADEKVFMVDKRTNTTYGGSAALQAMQQWYTMQDVSDSIQPYKVFTALLTQSGGDFPYYNDYTIQDGMVAGRSYFISSNAPIDLGGTDFTISGASSNEASTWFISNGADPLWGSSEGTANFNGGAPLVTVLENTIGNVWWEYFDIGQYLIKSNDLFTQNKTLLFASSMNNGNDTNNHTATIYTGAPGELTFVSWGNTGDSQQELDNSIPLPIEIRVYN